MQNIWRKSDSECADTVTESAGKHERKEVKHLKYCHVGIVSKDWRALSRFYQEVFGCRPLDPERHNTAADKVLGVEGGQIHGEHVMVPGYGDEGPTLEIMTLMPSGQEAGEHAYDYGYAHICFEMDDTRPVLEKLLQHGGSILSTWPDPFEARCVYCKDPEGNIVEIRRPNLVPDTFRET